MPRAVTVEIPPPLYEKMSARAKKRRRPPAESFSTALKEYVDDCVRAERKAEAELPERAKTLWAQKCERLDKKWAFFFDEDVPNALKVVGQVSTYAELKALPTDPLTPLKLEAMRDIARARRDLRKELVDQISKELHHRTRTECYAMVDQVASLTPNSPQNALTSALPKKMERANSEYRSAYSIKSGELSRMIDGIEDIPSAP